MVISTTLFFYPDPHLCVKVRFLTVPGSYNGNTFPPGTGNVDAIVPVTSDLTGTAAKITTTTLSEGAEEMGGGFALSLGGEATETLQYTADETSVEAVLEVSIKYDPNRDVQKYRQGRNEGFFSWCL